MDILLFYDIWLKLASVLNTDTIYCTNEEPTCTLFNPS